MGYDYYFINETKKQIVSSKYLTTGFECESNLMAYLACCKNDTVRIVGEENDLIEREVFGGNGEYDVINLSTFNIPSEHEDRIESLEWKRLRFLVFKNQ